MAGLRTKRIVTVNYSVKVGDVPDSQDVPIAAIYQAPETVEEQAKPVQQRQNLIQQQPRNEAKKKHSDCCFTFSFCFFLIILPLVMVLTIGTRKDTEWNVSLELSSLLDKYRNNNVMGDVLVKIDQESGMICDENFGMNEANVVCRQHGYPKGAAGFSVQGLFQSKIQADFVISQLKCTGNELNLEHCQSKLTRLSEKDNWTNKVKKTFFKEKAEKHKALMEVSNVAGVICHSGGIGFTRSILINGTAPWNGHVFVINHHGLFGPVCDQDWGPNEAQVLCHQLGYPTADSYSIGSYFGGIPRTLQYALNSLTCQGNERYLGECQNHHAKQCKSNLAAGVVCHHDDEHDDDNDEIIMPRIDELEECLLEQLAGDGYCDDFLNNDLCDFDGGDCCGPNPNLGLCSDCQCKAEEAQCLNFLMGDGICNDINNKSSCGFDSGDCLIGCNETLYNNGHCDSVNDNEICYFDAGDCLLDENECSPSFVSFIGDGFCQDHVNIPQCDYDAQDCCQGLHFECVECVCHQECDETLMNNDVCDLVNNKIECFHDNGDCWVTNVPYLGCALPFLVSKYNPDFLNKSMSTPIV